ncbi:MAG: hypothetical protein SWC96_03125 [Thermodesulfobacteriota bacterium]|nr:hypothetical protein [Thermodesulfobacteriota bacterium]
MEDAIQAAQAPANELEDLRARYEKLVEINSSLNERVLELYTLYNVSRTLSTSLHVAALF